MKRIITGILAISVLLAGGCARKEQGKRQTTIKWAFWAGPLKVYEKIVDAFEKDNPGIKVDLMQIPCNAYYQKVPTMLAAGTAPDIFWLNSAEVPHFAQRGALYELDSLIDRDAQKIQIEDFYPQVLEACRDKGKLYGIPKGINVIIIAYNKDMFDEAGVNYPSDGWTWDDLLQTAQKLTKDTNGDGKIDQFGFANPGEFHNWPCMMFVWQNGGEVFNKDNTECTLNSPEVMEAIQFYFDLSKKYRVSPSLGQLDLDYYAQFKTKKVAMVMGAHPLVPGFNKVKGLNWDIAPLPQKKRKITSVHTGCFVISSQTKHLEEAWRFVLYITGKEAARTYFKIVGEEMPPRKSLAHIQHDPSRLPEHHQIFYTELKYARLWPPNVPHMTKIMQIWQNELEMAYFGGKTLKKACDASVQKVNSLLKEGEK